MSSSRVRNRYQAQSFRTAYIVYHAFKVPIFLIYKLPQPTLITVDNLRTKVFTKVCMAIVKAAIIIADNLMLASKNTPF